VVIGDFLKLSTLRERLWNKAPENLTPALSFSKQREPDN